ncbi:MAG TPA: hypothetical protein VF893_00680, partial [Candidatus Bathyarchaeia archaeon]
TIAPSGILSSQTTTIVFWPTPAGFGETFTKAYVGICHAGVCAVAVGIRIIEEVIETIKNIAINVAVVLLNNGFITFFLLVQ